MVKGNGTVVSIVSDFKRLNQGIERLIWPPGSSSQLLCHIDPEARFFVSLDLTFGYHQIRIDGPLQIYRHDPRHNKHIGHL